LLLAITTKSILKDTKEQPDKEEQRAEVTGTSVPWSGCASLPAPESVWESGSPLSTGRGRGVRGWGVGLWPHYIGMIECSATEDQLNLQSLSPLKVQLSGHRRTSLTLGLCRRSPPPSGHPLAYQKTFHASEIPRVLLIKLQPNMYFFLSHSD
jgi:hypothetical protein